MKKVKSVVSFIDETCFSVSIVALTALTVISVFMRYVVNKPIIWSEEVQMILVVWVVFFGASVAFREYGHIAIDILFVSLPRYLQTIVSFLSWLFVAGSISWIGVLQYKRMLKLFASQQSTTILNIPRWITYAVVTFACLLMLISHIICGIETQKKRRTELQEDSDHE